MPPASAAQAISPNSDGGLGFSLLLGTDYERKKNKLQQELQLDYRQYVAKKKDLKTSEPRPQPEGVSLLIDEKTSLQEKLREERNKEYNLFLQEQAQKRTLKRRTPAVTSKVQTSDAVCLSPPASLPILNTRTDARPPSRRDAATLTEAVDVKRAETWHPGRQGRRRWQLYRLRDPYSSEEELITDEEEELEFRRTRRHFPECKEERRTRDHRANRAPQDIKEAEAPGIHPQNSNERGEKSDLQMPDSMRTAARSGPPSSKEKAEFATGLIIGATEEQTASQMRKEQYKQELLKQIAEQQRNKIREKKLELRVAATGATDPEKEPHRIRQFGAVNRRHDNWKREAHDKPGTDVENPNPRPPDDKATEDRDQRGFPGKSHMDDSTALSQLTGKAARRSGSRAAHHVPSLDYFSEDYHRDFSNTLGEVVIPRVAGPPPPAPPTITNNYSTPYDAAYYYYGSRNPLDPHNQNSTPEGVQQSGNFQSPPPRPPSLRPSRHTEEHDQQRSPPLIFGELPGDKFRQRRGSALSYQEALREQIREREEHKRREKEEKEKYDAKIKAEMMAYNPWGRSGGGAPIKDQKGNLVSNLTQMHKINKESYRNPESMNTGQVQTHLMRNGDSPRVEARVPLSHQLSGFSDQPSPQQLHMQDRYKEQLKQQIEENKRKREEERERLRIEEEKEERRLAEQRARIQQEYEEEQRRQNKVQHRLENQSFIREPTIQHQVVKKRVRQRQEVKTKTPESATDQEEKKPLLSYELQREPSPPIPTLRKKQTNLVASRPSSAVSHLSSRTERSVSAPHCRNTAKTPQLQDGQQEVIRELSALRRYLRKEQRQLEVQLGQTDRQESHYSPPSRPRGRPRVDDLQSAREAAVQPSTRSPSSAAARVNMQNIREFNQLKYRGKESLKDRDAFPLSDTESREEVRHLYPDPPTDAQSLDIQQQALLREQNRKIRLMKRGEENDFLDQQLNHYPSRNKPGRYIHRDSILPSETAFIDVYSGEERVQEQRTSQPSAEHRERTAPQRRQHYDKEVVSTAHRNPNIHPDSQSLQSVASLNLESKVGAQNQQRIRRQSTGDHSSRSEELSGDEVDVSSLRSALERRVSVETVATEPWLRPGTLDAESGSGWERPNKRRDAPPWLTHRVP